MTIQLCSNDCRDQEKEYKLTAKDLNSDFNYQAIKFIDTTGKRLPIFNPIRGNYTVHTFIATYKGWSLRDEKQISTHDIIIVKTNNANNIIYAYQFTLEWAEMPLTYDLYKAKVNRLVLANYFPIEKLKFKRVNYDSKNGREFQEKGKLIF